MGNLGFSGAKSRGDAIKAARKGSGASGWSAGLGQLVNRGFALLNKMKSDPADAGMYGTMADLLALTGKMQDFVASYPIRAEERSGGSDWPRRQTMNSIIALRKSVMNLQKYGADGRNFEWLFRDIEKRLNYIQSDAVNLAKNAGYPDFRY